MKQKIFKTKLREDYEYNTNRVFLGVFAIIFGLIFLINSLSRYPLSFNFINFWPILIIFIGLSFFKRKNVVSTIIGSIITIICVTLFFYSIATYSASNNNYAYQQNTTPIVITKDMNMERAEIELNTGAGEVSVYGIDSNNLIEGKLTTSVMESKINQLIDGSVQKVNISFNGRHGMMKNSDGFKNKFTIGIDKNTPINLVFNSGGSSNNVNLSEIRAESVNINTGASNLSLKLGDAVNSNVVIEAGASSLNLSLPSDAGVMIKIESGFSSQELPGFILIGDKTYQSENYSSAVKKININITMGMASLRVDWYSPVKQNKISLFYYNQSDDKENTCDSDYILPVERSIPQSNNQIRDAINLLLKGKLTEKEQAAGFFTEFPNEKFKLLDSSLADGKLTLKFSEVPGFTTGGSCRVGILASEIIKTAKQFPEVKKIIFDPETLFEP